MLSDMWFALIGTVLGYLAGLIPGVGNVIMLLMTWPIITDASLFQMMVFYLGIISASQFSGSVIATVFGVPGESSSMPAVIEGNRMFHDSRGNFAISNAAMGSVLGSFVSLTLVMLLMPYAIDIIKEFYNNNVQLFILLFASISVIVLLGNNILVNTVVFALGFFLSMIGWNAIPFFLFLPEVIPYETFPKLTTGLPFFPMVVSLFVFPVLLNTITENLKVDSNKDYVDDAHWTDHVKEYISNLGASLRGSAFGCVIGFVPHVGTSVSSNLSYAYEKKKRIKQQTYNEDGDIESLVAAETANNATGMTSLVPLLLLGIPITTSEAILLSLIEKNSYVINYTTTIGTGFFENLVIFFVAINLFCFIASWPAVQYVNYLKKISFKKLLIFTGIVLVALVMYTGYREMNMLYYFVVMIALLPLGYLLRKTEPLVLVIAFVLQDKITSSISVFWQINFG